MKTKLASVFALFAFLAVLMIGAAGTASATNPDPDFDCVNGIGVQVCDNTVDVPVDVKLIITSIRALTGSELVHFETELDKLFVNAVTTVTKNDVKVLVLNIYTGDFNITILSGNVVVLGNLPCPC
jgi:hypothetical protein